ncbi:MAG TPA: hypothetical protein VNS57_02465 [Steroidobacteraceae bacterium]|nr:hypothetical protein [Steroidobacteraceae bacterium]
MRKHALAVVISSVLLGAAAAHAEPGTDAWSEGQQAQSTTQTDTSRPAPTSTAPDADTATGTSATGSMDADQGTTGNSSSSTSSSSSSYPPASSATPGNDTSATASAGAGEQRSDQALLSTEHWTQADANGDGYLSQTELTTAAPTLSASFSAMDANSDQKLTRDELQSWHQSQRGSSMDADQGSSSSSSSSSSSDTTGTSNSSSSTSTTDDTTSPPTDVEQGPTGQ